MYCPYCLKFINAPNPEVCPHCGKNLKKKKKAIGKQPNALGVILLILGILLVLTALTEDTEPTLVSSSPAAVTTTQSPKTFGIGDTAELHGVRVTLNGVTESRGSEFMGPSSGNIFVTCEFTIENNTSSDVAVSSMMSFTAYFDDYAANLSLGAMTMDDSKQQLDGTVASGKKIRGVIGYEAPATWKTIEVQFVPEIYSYDTFIFKHTK